MARKIQRALLSVYDKTGITAFAQILVQMGVEIISTGGTAKMLKENGLEVIELSEYTGFPEMLDGRVKTLHPKIHGGLLYLRDDSNHIKAVQDHKIGPIDLVVVNLYPFEATVAKPDVTWEKAIENIDIGGPAMLRSAAKNHGFVTVISDPADYSRVANELIDKGDTSSDIRKSLAAKVFSRTSAYDAAIARYLLQHSEPQLGETPRPGSNEPENEVFPDPISLNSPRVMALRYGENPHQKAALYGAFNDYFKQLHGKALSYNNILDLTAATDLIEEFTDDHPTLAILKHTNPCGVGQGASLKEAWYKAFATDKQAPFGGIIAMNRALDAACALAISDIFSEVVVAPEFHPEALEILQKRKNLRLIQILKPISSAKGHDLRHVGADSLLAQEKDTHLTSAVDLNHVTERQPTPDELSAMLFGWKIVKHVKSNAIVYVGKDRTLGIGAGQMSRVDASRIAVWKASEAGLSLKGSVVCSDAFFPFPDGLIAAAEAGATAAIQPGGSVRDTEVVKAANERHIAMAFTGVRHFRH